VIARPSSSDALRSTQFDGSSGSVLITGAGGFVGSAVTRSLVKKLQGAVNAADLPTFADGRSVGRVVAMLRPSGTLERLEELAPSVHWTVVRVDLTNRLDLAALLAEVRPRAILHLAMDGANYSADPTEERLRESVDQPLETLFSGLKDVPGARIVTTGSAAVLEPGSALDEDSVIRANPSYLNYARTKIREETLISVYGPTLGVPWLHLRLFYTFGKYEARTRLLPHIVSHLARSLPASISSGDQIRDFTDVEDVAEAYVQALSTEARSSGRTYHVGSGRGISVREFAESVAEVTGRSDLLRFGAASPADSGEPTIVANASRARRELGWAAASDTSDKIKRAAEWWLDRLRRA
jgi:nucleoside-diphosphate-sugar epimerase